MTTKPYGIIITLEGGLVSAVVAHYPQLIGLPVTVIDYDTEGADDSEICTVDQADGSSAEAICHTDTVAQATVGPIEWSE